VERPSATIIKETDCSQSHHPILGKKQTTFSLKKYQGQGHVFCRQENFGNPYIKTSKQTISIEHYKVSKA